MDASAAGDYGPQRLPARDNSRVSLPRAKQSVDHKAIRDFVLYNYAHVADDIINGKGIYLDTLAALLEIGDSQKEAWRKGLLVILLEKEIILEFSNCVAGYAYDH